MENLFFCLNATLPIFFTMLLGYGFRKIGLLDESFIKKINRFVFRAALPLLLLEDLWSADFQTLWDGKFVGFCAAITIGGGLVSVLCSRLVKDENIRGEFAQAAFRSNSALLGIAFISNIYGKSDMASLMLIGNVPFNNILAVIILLFMKPDGEKKAAGNLAKETVKGILTNPIILGIAGGMLLSVCHVPQVTIVSKTVHNLTSLATPLGLMAMGGSFEGEESNRSDPAGTWCNVFATGRNCHDCPAACSPERITKRTDGRSTCSGRFFFRSQLFYYGKKYGTRRNAYLECGHAYYAGKCFYYDSMAVCAALLRSGVGV